MYELKRIIHHEKNLEIPMCMYEMKNIHGNNNETIQECRIASNVTKQVINFLKTPLPDTIALKKRQEKILESLDELRNQIGKLSNDLKGQNKDIVVCNESPKNREPVTAELTITVNPGKPCYSLLALEKLWKDVDFPVKCYVSSDLKEPVKNIFKNTEPTGKSSVINLSLIWKNNVLDTCLMVSGLHSFPIMGEINILRYFARLLGYENYEESSCNIEKMKIDLIFDLSHKILYVDSKKDLSIYLSLLNEKLGKNGYFSGRNYPGISDVALWSSIKQINPKLPENIGNWYKKCEQYFL